MDVWICTSTKQQAALIYPGLTADSFNETTPRVQDKFKGLRPSVFTLKHAAQS